MTKRQGPGGPAFSIRDVGDLYWRERVELLLVRRGSVKQQVMLNT
jgi:hypothetical protein